MPAQLPRSIVQRCPWPARAPAGCTHPLDLERWHGCEVERRVEVDVYQVHPPDAPAFDVHALDDRVVRIAAPSGKPMRATPLVRQVLVGADDVGVLNALSQLAPARHSRRERAPFGTRPPLWRLAWEATWSVMAMLWDLDIQEGDRRGAPRVYERGGKTVAVQHDLDVAALVQLWRALRRSAFDLLWAPPPWPWWQRFLKPGAHPGEQVPLPVLSFHGKPSAVGACVSMLPSVRLVCAAGTR